MFPFPSIATLACLLQFAGAPISSAPTTQSSELTRAVGVWLAQTADPDPEKRDSAAENLMSLHVDELPTLIDAIKASRTVAPSQEIALHDIVAQVYLASREYGRAIGSAGFLGVQLAPSYEQIRGSSNTDTAGAIVYGRIPGFIAYRRLRDGDFIVGIQDAGLRVANRDQLIERIKQFHAGDVVHLNVQRGGKEIVVPIRLDPRPLEESAVVSIAGSINNLGSGAFVTLVKVPILPITTLREMQKLQAEDFWDQNFAPLFSERSAALN